jgi:predicted DNA-binding protein
MQRLAIIFPPFKWGQIPIYVKALKIDFFVIPAKAGIQKVSGKNGTDTYFPRVNRNESLFSLQSLFSLPVYLRAVNRYLSPFILIAFCAIFCYKILHIIYTQKRGVKMLSTARQEKVRINIQLPAEIKDRLFKASTRKGKNVSTLVRESIEEKLMQLDRQDLEERMKAAYQDLADENIRICEDFKFSDAENLPEVTP